MDYGIIGNCKSAALVKKTHLLNGFVYLNLILPQFLEILDENIGGSFEIIPDKLYNINQKYIENTNILITYFKNKECEFEVIDFMPRYKKNEKYHNPPEVIRILKPIKGKPSFSLNYNPKLEYANGETNSYVKDKFIVSVYNKENFDTLYLYSNLDYVKILRGGKFDMTKDIFF